MKEQKCGKCGVLLGEGIACTCDDLICCNCCTCDVGCNCSCRDK